MDRRYVFADEAGDFEFARKPNVSKYFIVCIVRMDSCQIGHDLLELRRQLLWENLPVQSYFHCCEDKQIVRDRVFDLIRQSDIRIYAQILEKAKAQPQTRINHARFYKYGWFFLWQYVGRRITAPETELMITAASVKTKKAQAVFTDAVNDVLQQTVPRGYWTTVFCPAAADPCLQVADYCTWAIQRKWESEGRKNQAYRLIHDKIYYEYDQFEKGTHYYY